MKWIRVIISDARNVSSVAFVNLLTKAVREAMKKRAVFPGEQFPKFWAANIGEHGRAYFFDPAASANAREYGILNGLNAEEVDPPGTHTMKKLDYKVLAGWKK